MARRSKKHKPEENHERWLITYSDLITLLLIFFVIMYAMSKVDVAKFQILAQALNFQFKKADSVMQHNSSVIGSVSPGKKEKGDTKNVNGSDKTKNDKESQKEQELQNLYKVINNYIVENHLKDKVSVANTPKGISITLNDLFLFDLGKADLKPPAYPILDKLASLFPKLKNRISIEGNTDNLPLATGSVFKDNWGLGFARSLSVLRYFVDQKNLDQQEFKAVSWGDTNPVAANDTPAHRQQNRRVEIVVLRN